MSTDTLTTYTYIIQTPRPGQKFLVQTQETPQLQGQTMALPLL